MVYFAAATSHPARLRDLVDLQCAKRPVPGRPPAA
jgi:hypothetical protein